MKSVFGTYLQTNVNYILIFTCDWIFEWLTVYVASLDQELISYITTVLVVGVTVFKKSLRFHRFKLDRDEI